MQTMETFYGIVFVVIVSGITILLVNKYKEIAMIIAIAFVFRISAALINLYVVTLPDGGIDALGFEERAWIWGKDGLREAIPHFFESGPTWVYSNLASLLYAIFGRSPLILQSISVLVGVYCVVLVWRLSIEVWGSYNIAKVSAWLVALSPILILYSSLTLREVFITTLLLYGMLHVILWSKTKQIINAFIAIIAFSFQILLHPGIATAGVLFIFLIFLYYNKVLFTGLINKSSIDQRSILIVATCLIVGVFIYLFSKSLAFPYSNWLEIMSSEKLIWRTSIMASGAASYPSWLIADTPMQFLLLLIPKFFYFLFSPFPWDISKFKHVFGMFDGVIYILLFISIYGHRKYIKSNPQALLIILFIIFLALIFTVAVGNFGTGIRHRSKLLPIIIVIAAPFIYRVFFSRRKN
jgi:hypothetical protein